MMYIQNKFYCNVMTLCNTNLSCLFHVIHVWCFCSGPSLLSVLIFFLLQLFSLSTCCLVAPGLLAVATHFRNAVPRKRDLIDYQSLLGSI